MRASLDDAAAQLFLLLCAVGLLPSHTLLPCSASRLPHTGAVSAHGDGGMVQLQAVEESKGRLRARDFMRRQRPWAHQADQAGKEENLRWAQAHEGVSAVQAQYLLSQSQDPSHSQFPSERQARPEALSQPQTMLDGEEDGEGIRLFPQDTMGGHQHELELALAHRKTRGLPWTSSESLSGEEREMDAQSHIASVVGHGLWGAFTRFFGWAYGQQTGQQPSGGDDDDAEVTEALFWAQPAVVSPSELKGRLHQLLMSDDIDADLDEVLAYLALGDMEPMK